MPELPPYVSYSQVTGWLNCGEQYRLQKLERVPEVGSWWSVGGTAVHSATEAYDRLWCIDGDTDGFNAQERFEDALEDAIANSRAADGFDWRSSRGQEKDWWLEDGPRQVQGWIDWRNSSGYRPLQLGDTYAIEARVQADIGGISVLGYIDRLEVNPDGELVILDLKSGSRKPSHKLQLQFYRLLIERSLGLQSTLGGYFMTRKAELVGPDPIPDTSTLDRLVAGFVRARELDIYVPNPAGTLCGVCGVQRACYAVGGIEAEKYAPSLDLSAMGLTLDPIASDHREGYKP